MYKVLGPPDVPAKYDPKLRSLVVLVENYQGSTAYTDDELLSRYVEEGLKGNIKAPIIPSSKVRELMLSKGEAFKTMTVAEVGRAVGAQQVIWVDVGQTRIEPLLAGESMRGDVSASVKVVEAQTGQTLWPKDLAGGYALSHAVSFGAHSPNSELEIKETLYRGIGDRIAKLFYKWKPENAEPEGFVGQ